MVRKKKNTAKKKNRSDDSSDEDDSSEQSMPGLQERAREDSSSDGSSDSSMQSMPGLAESPAVAVQNQVDVDPHAFLFFFSILFFVIYSVLSFLF